MGNPIVVGKIARTMIDAINLWLLVTGHRFRVRDDGIVITFKDGILLMALREASHDRH